MQSEVNKYIATLVSANIYRFTLRFGCDHTYELTVKLSLLKFFRREVKIKARRTRQWLDDVKE